MNKVIAALSLVTFSAIYFASALFNLIPSPVGNSVIADSESTGSNRVSVVIPKGFTKEQSNTMKIAYDIAKADGHKSPEIVQAMILQETMAGGLKNFRVANPGPEAYFGISQVKLAAAKDVISRFPGILVKYNIQSRNDEEIKANLILNDKFNIAIGSKYLLILNREYGFTGRELLNAYNRGPGGVRLVSNDFHYAKGAEQKLAMYNARL
jgi:hypothetical protein